MAMLVRFGDSEKVKRKINACRDAGYKVFDNFITGVKTVEYDNVVILKCARQSPGRWKIEYNDDFWEEVEAESTEHLAIPQDPLQEPTGT